MSFPVYMSKKGITTVTRSGNLTTSSKYGLIKDMNGTGTWKVAGLPGYGASAGRYADDSHAPARQDGNSAAALALTSARSTTMITSSAFLFSGKAEPCRLEKTTDTVMLVH